MSGKSVLITGATWGIGRATALALVKKGAHVTIIGRDQKRVNDTLSFLKKQATDPGVEIKGLVGDLSVQAEICRLADEYQKNNKRLDVLINNAGGIFGARELTYDGFERTWALNHLAYVLLTLRLIDFMETSVPARIINVASHMHKRGRIHFDDLNGEMTYSALDAYRQSKLANILFTKALARHVEGQGITVNALHPGAVATGMGRDMKPWMQLGNRLMQLFFLSPEKGAQTSVYLASSPEVADVNGQYFVKSKAVAPAAICEDEQLQQKLWDVSLEQVKANLLRRGPA